MEFNKENRNIRYRLETCFARQPRCQSFHFINHSVTSETDNEKVHVQTGDHRFKMEKCFQLIRDGGRIDGASRLDAIGKRVHGRRESFGSNFEMVRRRVSSRSIARSHVHHYRITRCFAAQFRNRAVPLRWILSRYYARIVARALPVSRLWLFAAKHVCPESPNFYC